LNANETITDKFIGQTNRPARFEGESERWRENLVAIARFERTLAQGAATCDPARSRCP
jgi:hypothetical protein